MFPGDHDVPLNMAIEHVRIGQIADIQPWPTIPRVIEVSRIGKVEHLIQNNLTQSDGIKRLIVIEPIKPRRRGGIPCHEVRTLPQRYVEGVIHNLLYISVVFGRPTSALGHNRLFRTSLA